MIQEWTFIIVLFSVIAFVIVCRMVGKSYANEENEEQTIDIVTPTVEDWVQAINEATNQQEAIRLFIYRPFECHRIKYAFYDKMHELELADQDIKNGALCAN